jgi:hypothetical protein
MHTDGEYTGIGECYGKEDCPCKKFKPQTPQKTNSHPEIKLGNSGGNSAKEQSSPDKRTKLDDTNTQTPPTLKMKINDLYGEYNITHQRVDKIKTDIALSIKRLRDVLISRMCRPNKSLNTFENAREQEEIIKEEFDEIMGVWQDE